MAIHREVAARLRADPEAVMEKARMNLIRWTRNRGDCPAMREWSEILRTRSPEGLAAFIESATEEATRLRQSSPFAGVLTPEEVWEIKRSHAPARA